MAFDKIRSKWFNIPTQTSDDTANAADPNGTLGSGYGGFTSLWTPGATGTYKNRLQAPFRVKWPGAAATELLRTNNGSWIWGNAGYTWYNSVVQADGLRYKLIYRSGWSNGYFIAGGAGNYLSMPLPNTKGLMEFDAEIELWTEPLNLTGERAGWKVVMTAWDSTDPTFVTTWGVFGGDAGYKKLDEATLAVTQNSGDFEARQNISLHGSIPNYQYYADSEQGWCDIWVATLHGTQANTTHRPGCRLYDIRGTSTFHPEPTARIT